MFDLKCGCLCISAFGYLKYGQWSIMLRNKGNKNTFGNVLTNVSVEIPN